MPTGDPALRAISPASSPRDPGRGVSGSGQFSCRTLHGSLVPAPRERTRQLMVVRGSQHLLHMRELDARAPQGPAACHPPAQPAEPGQATVLQETRPERLKAATVAWPATWT